MRGFQDSTSDISVMTRVALNTLTVLAAMGSALAPEVCRAYALDPQLDCQSTAHAFVEPLVTDQLIDPKPMRVEPNSVNVFRPTHDSNLTAFGFRVYAVLGYERDDALFQPGRGEPVAESAYGAIVLGSAEAVQARAHEAGSDAVVRQVVPLLLTAIFCGGH